jgi:predicted dehydrogenase
VAKVRVGVAGVGGMGQGHCEALQQVKEAKLVAVCDFDAGTAQRAGERFGVPCYTDHRAMMKAEQLDAILIATPHYFHPPIAIDAFRAGLHVLSEKPISVTVKEADRMLAAARRSGKVFSVMYQMRNDPKFRAVRKLLDEGKVGELIRANMVIGYYRSQAYYDSGGWRATWKGEGGGVLFNQAPHMLDIFTWLVGPPKFVTAQTRTRLHDIEVEDEAFALLEYENGAHGYLYASVIEAPTTHRLEIVGDKGKILIEGDDLKFWALDTPVSKFTRASKEMWGGPQAKLVPVKLETNREVTHAAIQRNFCRAILYGEPRLTPGEEGLHSVELADALTLSSHAKKTVKLPISRPAYEALMAKLIARSKPKKIVREQRITDTVHLKEIRAKAKRK